MSNGACCRLLIKSRIKLRRLVVESSKNLPLPQMMEELNAVNAGNVNKSRRITLHLKQTLSSLKKRIICPDYFTPL